METHKIYKLIDPNTLQVRYIGYTYKELYERLSGHIGNITSHGKRERNKHQLWICSLLKTHQVPIIKLVKKVTLENWQEWEIYYIAKYKRLGHDLTNNSLGGLGNKGTKWSQANRDKMSLARMGKANNSSIPIVGTNIKTGEIIKASCAEEAARILRLKGINILGRHIRCCTTGKKHKGKIKIKEEAGGYTWKNQLKN